MPLFDSLYNFAHWLTQDRAEAEDLVQETCAKALRGFPSFRLGTNFRAWVFRILRNTFYTSRTGLKVASMVSLDESEGGEIVVTEKDTPESILISNFRQEEIQRAIEQLSIPLREILLLCDVEEMSYRDAAETLGIPIGTVMSRLSRARRSMRQYLTGAKEGTRATGRQS